MRRGWTLHEMLITLGVMSGMVAVAVQVAVGQMRLLRGQGEVAALSGQLSHATDIVANVLWGAYPAAGDIVAATDSSLELRSQIGTAITCAPGSGLITIPAPTVEGNTLSAFLDAPAADDVIMAFLADSAGGTWLTLRVAAPPVAGGCVAFSASSAWLIPLREQIPIPVGTALRFLRPLRMSLYRASDSRWYLGARDWNADAQRLNTIQPVAGPLQPYSRSARDTGLLLSYYDANGDELAPGMDVARAVSVRIVARGTTVRPARIAGRVAKDGFVADSVAVTIALRNAQ